MGNLSVEKEGTPMKNLTPFRERGLSKLIKRKWNTFQKDPIGSVKWRVRSLIPWLLRQWAGHKLRQKGALDVLLDFHAHRPPSADLADFTDLWFLYRTIRHRKPRTILEFGSGCSTVILAQALWDNQCHSPERGSYLYSVDADPYWAEATAKAMPTYLQKFCRIVYSPFLEVEHSGTLGSQHANIPDIAPNFLYLDEPAPSPRRMDILDMEDKFPQDFYMVIDDRQEDTAFLKRNMRRRYRFKKRYWGCFLRTQIFELIN
jgi:hypothetical protein